MDYRQNISTIHCRILIQKGITDPKTLVKQSGASRQTVWRLRKEAANAATTPLVNKGGRPSSLNKDDKRRLRLLARKNPHLSNPQLARKLGENGGPKVSPRTIGRALQSLDIKRKRPRPVLSSQRDIDRRDWPGASSIRRQTGAGLSSQTSPASSISPILPASYVQKDGLYWLPDQVSLLP